MELEHVHIEADTIQAIIDAFKKKNSVYRSSLRLV